MKHWQGQAPSLSIRNLEYPEEEPDKEVEAMLALLEEYVRNDIELKRPLCMKSLCVKLQGHKGICVRPFEELCAKN